MKNLILTVLVIFSVGCNSLKRITDGPQSTPAAPIETLPDDYYVTGVASTDFDKVIMPTQGRTIAIIIWRPGDVNFTTLSNKSGYQEYAVFSIPRDGVRFTTRIEYFVGGGYTLGTLPAVPVGTKYRIHSIKNT